MKRINSNLQNRLKPAIYLVLSVGFISAMAMSLKNKNLTLSNDNEKTVAGVSTDEDYNHTALIDRAEKKDAPTDADKKSLISKKTDPAWVWFFGGPQIGGFIIQNLPMCEIKYDISDKYLKRRNYEV